MKDIRDVAKYLGIEEDELETYGKYKAKISNSIWNRIKNNENGKLILVTAMSPTPAGEGKTLTTIGLSQALNRVGKKTIAALREPSLGPVFGVKGGATGSGKAQILPAEDINLHFTGDMHAITSAHNLLSALLDNHIFQGNSLGINTSNVVWKRVIDMNDRALRNIVVNLGETKGGLREDGFNITAASEIMAILCLSEDIYDLKNRVSKIIVAYTNGGESVTAKDLGAEDAMCLLLKDAIKPNLVQTTECTPAFVHGGPFANIAHGCSTVVGTKFALKLADYVVTEAGFGADLGAEKFLDIKCRSANLIPDGAVIVATIKALKYNAGVKKDELHLEDPKSVKEGFCNLKRHIYNIYSYGIPVVVALNHFSGDYQTEVDELIRQCNLIGVPIELSQVWEKGGAGGENLAKRIISLVEKEKSNTFFKYFYDVEQPIKSKIETIVKGIYGGSKVTYSAKAEKSIQKIEKLGLDKLPICMAKTQYSFSDQPDLLGSPKDFTVNIREISLSAGAGFIVAITGNIMTMPGLPKEPSALKISLDENGEFHGLI